MLKKFFLNTLSSFVGAWIAIAICVLGVVVFIFASIGKLAFSSAGEVEQLTKKSILAINLEGSIEEVEKSREFDISMLMQGDVDKPQTLNVLVKAIQESAENKNISGIYLKCNGVSAAPATLHALRDALKEFKKSGKKIYAYGDNLSQGDYYLASAADSVFMNPQGMLALHGISGTSLYMKDLLDKLGVQMQVVKVGTFKSAVEPYILNEMSEPARAQLDTLYTNMWNVIKQDIADSRGVSPALIDTVINKGHITFRKGEYAVKQKLVDALAFERTMDDKIGAIVGKDGEDVNYVSPLFLVGQTDWRQFSNSKDQVAVLYATGEISENAQNGINCYDLVPVINDLTEDDNVKAVVLRVNSPGGSVFGTEQIWESLENLKKNGKPFVVSMGDYAASGGYWISSGADYIFADPLTVTGSIGIFGLIPDLSGLMQKVGLSPQTVSTNPGADFPDLFHPMTEDQHSAMQLWINQGYDQFITRVSTGRKIPAAKVRAIAEGRVWDGMNAKRLGLVNELGSLQNAIEYAAKKAGISDKYNVGYYPELQPSFWDMMPQAEMAQLVQRLRVSYPDVDIPTLVKVANILSRKPVQARMPEITLTL